MMMPSGMMFLGAMPLGGGAQGGGMDMGGDMSSLSNMAAAGAFNMMLLQVRVPCSARRRRGQRRARLSGFNSELCLCGAPLQPSAGGEAHVG
jgi:hypothetical protein